MSRALKTRFLWGTTFFCFLPAVLFSQSGSTFGGLQPDIKFEHFTKDDRLGHNYVTCILQDRQGFLWVGTLGSVWRYDGYNFRFARYGQNDSSGLSYPEIQSLCEDSEGNLWVGMQRGGLNLFDRETGNSARYNYNPADVNSLSDGVVLTIYEEQAKPGVLWIGTTTGLCRMTRDAEGNPQFLRYQHLPGNKNSLGHNVVYAICQDSSGIFWIGTRNGLNRFEPQSGIFTHYKPNEPLTGASDDNIVRSMVNDGDSLLWLGMFNGFSKFNLRTKTFTIYRHDAENPNSISDNKVYSVCRDRFPQESTTRKFWIATAAGLNHFDAETETFTNYRHNPDDPYSLNDDLLLSLYQDRSGVLWIGSGRGGLNKLPFRHKNFKHYMRRKNVSNTLNDNHVWAIHEDRLDRLWVGTISGLNIFDEHKRTVTYYQHDPNQPDNSLSDNFVTAIVEDRSGKFWVSTVNGLNLFDPETGKSRQFTHHPGDPNSLSHSYVGRLHVGHSGALWIGTKDGLNKLILQADEETGEETVHITRYYPDPVKPAEISDNFIQAIYEDRRNRVWIGTREGLTELDQNSGIFTNFKHDPADPHSLSYNNIWSIYEDSLGELWIGTTNMLDKLDRETKIFQHYDPYTENRGYGVGGLLEDGQGNLWFYGSKSLGKFNRQSESFRHYNVSDGLQSNDFNNAYFKNKHGELFYGGQNGFNVFSPEELGDNLHIPPIAFTGFKLFNRSVPFQNGKDPTDNTIGWSPKGADGRSILQKSISETEEIVLSHNDNSFSIEFAALDFTAPEKNQYAYKLEDAQNEWIYLGTQRSITFTNLAPGNYNLRVKGSNNDGVWNEEGASLKITINPPWWRTWWAYAFYSLFALGLLYGARRYELNRQRLKHNLELKDVEAEKLQELDRLKARFFAGISHEFRTPLTLISGPVKQMLSGEFKGDINDQFHLILRSCNRLLRLVNQLLDLSKLESGKMVLQASPQDIVALTRQLTMSFESLASVHNIKLQFTGPEEPVMVYLEREHYEKIIINLLFNALKFTPEGGSVIVDLEFGISDLKDKTSAIRNLQSEISDSQTQRKYVEIRVSDTGTGISASDLPYIFDRFYQAGDAYAKDAQGSGIGLALAKELVELHHGEISVTSKVGKGSTFTVRLPLGKDHLRAEEIVGGEITVGAKHPTKKVEMYVEEFARDASPQHLQKVEMHTEELARDASPLHSQSPNRQIPKGAGTQSPNILIVEDNPDMRAFMRGYLSEHYRLIEAEDGAQGMKQALKHAPDLIISDVMMPNMDGFQFCEKIKTDERTSHIPVILLTARASGESKIEGLETGADDYLTKPFDAKELRVRINNLIEQRRRLRERFQRELVIQPSEVTVTSMDEAFLKKVMAAVEAHIDDPAFETDDLAREAGVSRRHLNRKLRALTGQSVREFIRTLRLKRAAQLLQQKSGTVTEIAYEVGFQSIAHFAKIFREQFGVAPSGYGGEG